MVDYTLTPVDFHEEAMTHKLPSEAGVGTFISDPDISLFHYTQNMPTPFRHILFSEYKKLGGRGSKPGMKDKAGSVSSAELVTFWSSITFDNGVGTTDLVAIDDCIVDTGTRAGSRGDKFLVEIPT